MSILELGPLIEVTDLVDVGSDVDECGDMLETSSFASSDYMWTSSDGDDLSSEDEEDVVAAPHVKQPRIHFPYVFRTDQEADALYLDASVIQEPDYFTNDEVQQACSPQHQSGSSETSGHNPPQDSNVGQNVDIWEEDDISEYSSRGSVLQSAGQKRKQIESGSFLPMSTAAVRENQDSYLIRYITSHIATGKTIHWTYLSRKFDISVRDVKHRWSIFEKQHPTRCNPPTPTPVPPALLSAPPVLTLEVPQLPESMFSTEAVGMAEVPVAGSSTASGGDATPVTVLSDSHATGQNTNNISNTNNANSTTATSAQNVPAVCPKQTQAQLDAYILECVHSHRKWLLIQLNGFVPLWRLLGVELGVPVKTLQVRWRDHLRKEYCQRIGSNNLSCAQGDDSPTSPTITLTAVDTQTIQSMVAAWHHRQRGLWESIGRVLNVSQVAVMQHWSTITPVDVQDRMVRQACVVLGSRAAKPVSVVTAPSAPQELAPSSVLTNKAWHSTLHNVARYAMTKDITAFLMERRHNHTPEWLSKFPATVKRLEVALYYRADSLEMYVERSTLQRRLQEVLGGPFVLNNSVPDGSYAPTLPSTTTATRDVSRLFNLQSSAQAQPAQLMPLPLPQPSVAIPPTSTQILVCPATTSQPWHRPEHTTIRANMRSLIAQLLQSQNPQPTDRWLERLPAMLRQLNDALYHDAGSLQEYADVNTLRQRLHSAAVAMGSRPAKNTQPTPVGASSTSRPSQQPLQLQAAPRSSTFTTPHTSTPLAATAAPPPPVVRSTPLSVVPYHKAWHSNDHAAVRTYMVGTIAAMLTTRDISSAPDHQSRILSMARRLEDSLYQRAGSFEEYSNNTSLKARLHDVALAMGGTKQTQVASTRPAPVRAVPAVSALSTASTVGSAFNTGRVAIATAASNTSAPRTAVSSAITSGTQLNAPINNPLQYSYTFPASTPAARQAPLSATTTTMPTYEQLLSRSQHAHELNLLSAWRRDMEIWDAFKIAVVNRQPLNWYTIARYVNLSVISVHQRWAYITSVLQQNHVPVQLYLQNMQNMQNMQNIHSVPILQNRQVPQNTQNVPPPANTAMQPQVQATATVMLLSANSVPTIQTQQYVQNYGASAHRTQPPLPPLPPLSPLRPLLTPFATTSGGGNVVVRPPIIPVPNPTHSDMSSRVAPLPIPARYLPAPPLIAATQGNTRCDPRSNISANTSTNDHVDGLLATASNNLGANKTSDAYGVSSVVSDDSVNGVIVEQAVSDDEVIILTPPRVSYVVVDLTADD